MNKISDEDLEKAAKDYADKTHTNPQYVLHKKYSIEDFIAGAKYILSQEQPVNKNDWISVKDKLPDNDDEVLVFQSKHGIGNTPHGHYIGWYEKDKWNIYTSDGVINDADNNQDMWLVTHWRNLTNPFSQPSVPIQQLGKLNKSEDWHKGFNYACDVAELFESCFNHQYKISDVIKGKANLLSKNKLRKNEFYKPVPIQQDKENWKIKFVNDLASGKSNWEAVMDWIENNKELICF